MSMQYKGFSGIVPKVAILLLILFLAKQLTGAPNWSLFDFVVIGVLLSGTFLMFELVVRTVKKTKHRIALCAAILAALFVIWAELAVGIFGTPFAGS